MTSGYGIVLAVIVTMGVGMGLAMAPATESIMGSLPKAKAGVGSAVNDTTREVGGALGVAILGSLLAAGYHSSMDASAAVQALPAPAAAAAHDSLGGAMHVAGQLGAAGQPLLADATRAFVDAMSSTVLVGAAVAARRRPGGADLAAVAGPGQAVEEAEFEPISDDELTPGGRLKCQTPPRRGTHGEVADLVASLTSPSGRGRPRSTAADLAIVHATIDILLKDGYDGLTMAGVAQRAGVSTATLYRRYESKVDLVVGCITTLKEELAPGDRHRLAGRRHPRPRARRLCRLHQRRGVGLMKALIGEVQRNPELGEAVREHGSSPSAPIPAHRPHRARRRAGRDPTAGRRRAGPPDDHGARSCSAALVSGEPIDDEFADHLCTLALRLLGAVGRPRRNPVTATAPVASTTVPGEYHPAFEEYCEAIYELHEDDVEVIQARIADRLVISRPAVSEMIKRMEGEGLVSTAKNKIQLTRQGTPAGRAHRAPPPPGRALPHRHPGALVGRGPQGSGQVGARDVRQGRGGDGPHPVVPHHVPARQPHPRAPTTWPPTPGASSIWASAHRSR